MKYIPLLQYFLFLDPAEKDKQDIGRLVSSYSLYLIAQGFINLLIFLLLKGGIAQKVHHEDKLFFDKLENHALYKQAQNLCIDASVDQF